MRISDWSSDVCSSDLLIGGFSLLILFLAGPVFILIFAFAIRYRRGKQVHRDHPPHSNVWLETDPESVVEGKSVAVSVDLGGRQFIKKKNITNDKFYMKQTPNNTSI